MYAPDPHNWDHPVPVWAMRPPPTIWDPDYLQKLDPRYQLDPRRTPRGPLRTSSKIGSRKPTQVLPDGTIVVPIGSESENSVNSELDSNKYGSVRTLSDKYQKPSDVLTDDGIISHVVSSTTNGPISEDRSSIISLSDKYRQQEEVEIFHEHYQRPPPEPVRPKIGSKNSDKGSQKGSTASQSTESSRT